jgi:hypothetical protein
MTEAQPNRDPAEELLRLVFEAIKSQVWSNDELAETERELARTGGLPEWLHDALDRRKAQLDCMSDEPAS